MALEPIISTADIKTPEESIVRPRGWWENLGTGLAQGFKETTWSYLADIDAKTQATTEEPLTAEQYYNDPLRVPNVPYEPWFTPSIMSRIAEAHASHLNWEDNWQKSTGGAGAALYAGALIGNIPDPINLLPIGAGGSFLARVGKMGLVNATTEVGLTPLINQAYKSRGMDYTTEQMLMNVGFAGLIGAGLPFAIGGSAIGLRKAAKAMGLGERTLADNLVDAYSAKHGQKIFVDDTTINLINRKKLMLVNNDTNSVRRQNVYVPDKDITIDSRGRIYGSDDIVPGDVNSVKFRYDRETNTITLNGDAKDITKMGNSLLDRDIQSIPDNVNYRIITAGGPPEGVIVTREGFGNWIEKQVNLFNRSTEAQNSRVFKAWSNIKNAFRDKPTFNAELDWDWHFETRDRRYQVFPDKEKGFIPETGEGKMYEITDGKRREITDTAERTRIWKQLIDTEDAQLPRTQADEKQIVKEKSAAKILSEKTTTSPEVTKLRKDLEGLNTTNEETFLRTEREKKLDKDFDEGGVERVLDEEIALVQQIETRIKTTLGINPEAKLIDIKENKLIEYKEGTIKKSAGKDNYFTADYLETRFKDKIDQINKLKEEQVRKKAETDVQNCLSDRKQLFTKDWTEE